MLRGNPKNKQDTNDSDETKDERGLQKEKSYGQRREAPSRKMELPRRLPEGFESSITRNKDDEK